jgi:hypothetical protein
LNGLFKIHHAQPLVGRWLGSDAAPLIIGASGAIGMTELAQAPVMVVVQSDLGSIRVDLAEYSAVFFEAMLSVLPEDIDPAK